MSYILHIYYLCIHIYFFLLLKVEKKEGDQATDEEDKKQNW